MRKVLYISLRQLPPRLVRVLLVKLVIFWVKELETRIGSVGRFLFPFEQHAGMGIVLCAPCCTQQNATCMAEQRLIRRKILLQSSPAAA